MALLRQSRAEWKFADVAQRPETVVGMKAEQSGGLQDGAEERQEMDGLMCGTVFVLSSIHGPKL